MQTKLKTIHGAKNLMFTIDAKQKMEKNANFHSNTRVSYTLDVRQILSKQGNIGARQRMTMKGIIFQETLDCARKKDVIIKKMLHLQVRMPLSIQSRKF